MQEWLKLRLFDASFDWYILNLNLNWKRSCRAVLFFLVLGLSVYTFVTQSFWLLPQTWDSPKPSELWWARFGIFTSNIYSLSGLIANMGMRSASPPVGVEAIAAGVIAIAWSGTLLLLLPFNTIALGPFGFVTLSINVFYLTTTFTRGMDAYACGTDVRGFFTWPVVGGEVTLDHDVGGAGQGPYPDNLHRLEAGLVTSTHVATNRVTEDVPPAYSETPTLVAHGLELETTPTIVPASSSHSSISQEVS